MWTWATLPQQRDRLRPSERWPEPNETQRALLDRYATGEWRPAAGDEAAWSALSKESREDFETLARDAFHSAPWWVLRYISDYGVGPELLEFTANGPSRGWDDDSITKMLGCVLAVQKDGRVVYALPEGMKPGSTLAQRVAKKYFERFEL
tara:strand:+ start:497 stop:946 length:450 start_codon:yes stop_codon:yes gene_type:complete